MHWEPWEHGIRSKSLNNSWKHFFFLRVMLLIQNMFAVAFISHKNRINCHRELRINLITTRASFQSTEKHTYNDFPLGTNVQMWPMGKTHILHAFPAFLSGSLKAFHSPGTQSLRTFKIQANEQVLIKTLLWEKNEAVVLDSCFSKMRIVGPKSSRKNPQT